MAGPRVIIVGAGPAGIRCAETLVAAGVRPVVIDEGSRDGGQIYRRQPEAFTRSYATLYGTEAARAQAIHRTFDVLRSQIDYRPETLAWNVADGHLYTVRGSRQAAVPFDALALCTGATDRLMPVKGWNFAGTYSLGGTQVALKAQACSIGKRVVFVGTGALLYLVAAQYLKAGAGVAAVLDTSLWSRRISALPKLLANPKALWNGVALTRALRRGGVPVHTGIEPVEIAGTAEAGVTGFAFKDAGGQIHRIACDAVALGYHLRPETQLADLARCEFHFDADTRQWLPRADADGRTSVRGVYLAGDGACVLGANAAESAGRLAALAVLKDVAHLASPAARQDASQRAALPDAESARGQRAQAEYAVRASAELAQTSNPTREREMHELRAELARLRRFAQGLSHAFPWPAQQAAHLTDDTIVCRCESVTVGELRRVVLQAGARESNRAKAFSRVGMGRCQGRYCGHAAAEVIAHAANVSLEDVGRLRGQAPVKPLPIAVETPVTPVDAPATEESA